MRGNNSQGRMSAFPDAEKNLIRGPMFGQLHQWRPRTSNNLADPTRRFPPPWSVEEQEACFVVRDHSGQALAHVRFNRALKSTSKQPEAQN